MATLPIAQVFVAKLANRDWFIDFLIDVIADSKV